MQQEVIEGFRLSPQQKRLWLLQQVDHSLPYRAQCAVPIEGNLNREIFTAALRHVFARHEILRTTFQCLPGMTIPVQVIADGGIPSIDTYNMSGWDSPKQEAKIEALFQEARQLPFDFAQGPLSRISLVTLSPDKHMLLVTLSALCADTASLENLVHEISRSYAACLRREKLSDEPRQYADLAEWHNELLESADTETAREYWRKQDISALLTVKLPYENQPSGKLGFAPQFLTSAIHPDMAAKIGLLIRKYDASLAVFFLACWQTLLWRLTGQSDFVIGMDCDGRTYEELKDTLGLSAKYLPLQCHLEENLQFSELLARVNASAREVLEWQEYFSWEHLGGAREDSTSPSFFSTSFAFAEQPAKYAAANVTFSLHKQLTYIDRFKVKLSCMQREDRLLTEFHYDAHVFGAEDIGRLAGQFHTLLESVIRDPEAAISELAILSGSERQQLLAEFNDTKTDYPKDACLHQLFEEQVERTPENVAVVFEDRQLTYAQLNARANQLAHHLQTLSVGSEVLVAIYLEHSLEMLVGLLGILKAGGAYVPLDSASPKERLASMLEDTQAQVLLTQAHMVESMPEHGAHVICLDSGWEAIAQQNEENPVGRTTAENVAYVIYTSGSTGQPKGVMIEHGSLVNYLCWVNESLLGDTVQCLPLTTKLTFDACLKQLFTPLLRGGEVWMLSEEVLAQPAVLLSALGTRTRVGLNCVPSLWTAMLDAIHSGQAILPAESLTCLFVGGEQLGQELVGSSFSALPHLQIWNLYGPTEATANASVARIVSEDEVSIGQPIANTQIYILDPFWQPVPIGVPGELYIGGVGVARGYLNRPEVTAEKFLPNPFSDEPGTRLYKTGDLARYLPDGNIEFLGRVDHQVKIRGFRIELGEIEAVLGHHPAVRETIVVAAEDTLGEKRLVAYVVAAQQEPAPTSSELRRFLREKLPEYMAPAVFVLLEALPLLPNGKVDRRALPAPDHTRPELGKAFVAPRDALELQLTHIWEEVLDVRPIGMRDNFFELGGHSLLAVRLFTLIEHRLGKRLPLATVFQGATVEHLASLLRRPANPAPHSSLVAIQPDGGKRPLFLIHPAGGHVFPYVHLAHALGPDQPCYGLQAKGVEEGHDPHVRIEDMAASYIKALQTVQREGPYLLGGWSMGGIVAFEMAQQLHAQGQRVALLALLDARIPTPDEKFAEEDFEAKLLLDSVRYFGLSLDSWESLAQLPKDELFTCVLEQAKRASLVPQEIKVSQAQRFVQLLKTDFRATGNYVLHRYPSHVTLFKASEELAGTSPDPTLGWSAWAAGGVEVHVVPGNHANMVYKPHVEVLAEKLRACLNQVPSAEAMGQHWRQATDELLKEAQ